MATYVIGDVQGCLQTLLALIDKMELDDDRDRLWLAGDLVNRGPDSLGVLRWAKKQGDRLRIVLGNHDLHLLARWRGHADAREKDTLSDVLEAEDRDELLEWLLAQPLLIRDGQTLLVHAGLLPFWSAKQAESLAEKAMERLRGPKGDKLLARLSHKSEVEWSSKMTEGRRAEAVIRVMCNLRVCRPNGQPYLNFTGPPSESPDRLIPWYDMPKRRSANQLVVCGHWAAQGLLMREDMIALDSGCVWGGWLSAVRLEDRMVLQVPLSDRLPSKQWRIRRHDPPPGEQS